MVDSDPNDPNPMILINTIDTTGTSGYKLNTGLATSHWPRHGRIYLGYITIQSIHPPDIGAPRPSYIISALGQLSYINIQVRQEIISFLSQNSHMTVCSSFSAHPLTHYGGQDRICCLHTWPSCLCLTVAYLENGTEFCSIYPSPSQAGHEGFRYRLWTGYHYR
jgi:hypothetical protein